MVEEQERVHVYVDVDARKPGESRRRAEYYYVESADTKEEANAVAQYINAKCPPTDNAFILPGRKAPLPPYDTTRLKEKPNKGAEGDGADGGGR